VICACRSESACFPSIIPPSIFLADRAGSWVTVIIGAIFVFCAVARRKKADEPR
jgi:hypothetical protein